MDISRPSEFPVVFSSDGENLVGIVHPGNNSENGVLIAVGGPQYRVGSHRQFLLLARYLAGYGTSVMRFDFAGMGDSTGHHVGFENTFPQIRDAASVFEASCSNVRRLVVWGLCDAASTIAMHAHEDTRVTGMVLVNPWVRSETSLAKTRVKHYYWRRFISADFWRKVVSGKFRLFESLGSLFGNIKSATTSDGDTATLSYRMVRGLQQFDGDVLIILCGADVTALEFEDTATGSPEWADVLAKPNVSVKRIPDANHTFSRATWRDSVFDWTRDLVSGQ